MKIYSFSDFTYPKKLLKLRFFGVGFPSFCVLVVIYFYTFLSRFYYLEFLPLKYDEAVNSFLTNDMREAGFFSYDSGNYHGPLVFYFFYLGGMLFNDLSYCVRFVAAIFSVGIVALPWFYRRELGDRGALLASALLATSPAFSVFGRVGIHESIFVFFQFWASLSVLRMLSNFQTKNSTYDLTGGFPSGGIGAGLAFLGMLATKETWTIWFASLFIVSMLFARQFNPWLVFSPILKKPYFLIFCIFVFIGLYTGWGQDWGGIYNFFQGVFVWANIGVETGDHVKPWVYWLEIFLSVELLILLCGIFSVLVVCRIFKVPSLVHYFSCFSLVVFLIYSFIPYKTPWCVLPIISMFVIPFSLYFGSFGIFHPTFGRAPLVILITLGLIQIFEGFRVNFSYNSPDFHHSYYYSETTREFQNFVENYRTLVKDNGSLKDKLVTLYITSSAKFPLAYYLIKQNQSWMFEERSWTTESLKSFRSHTLRECDFSSWMVISEFPINWGTVKDRGLKPSVHAKVSPFTHFIRIMLRDGFPPLYVYYDGRVAGNFLGGESLQGLNTTLSP